MADLTNKREVTLRAVGGPLDGHEVTTSEPDMFEVPVVGDLNEYTNTFALRVGFYYREGNSLIYGGLMEVV